MTSYESDAQASEPPPPPIDPTALAPAAESAFSAYWSTWSELHRSASNFLEAVRHFAIMTGGDAEAQRQALDDAAQEAAELLRMAHAATARGAR